MEEILVRHAHHHHAAAEHSPADPAVPDVPRNGHVEQLYAAVPAAGVCYSGVLRLHADSVPARCSA
ncbi:hypothetical protein D3C86_1915280 [compost metagenome]